MVADIGGMIVGVVQEVLPLTSARYSDAVGQGQLILKLVAGRVKCAIAYDVARSRLHLAIPYTCLHVPYACHVVPVPDVPLAFRPAVHFRDT
jgi:hypothetical protein